MIYYFMHGIRWSRNYFSVEYKLSIFPLFLHSEYFFLPYFFSLSLYATRAAKPYFENSAYFHTKIVCWIFHAENVNMNKLQVATECICILECGKWKVYLAESGKNWIEADIILIHKIFYQIHIFLLRMRFKICKIMCKPLEKSGHIYVVILCFEIFQYRLSYMVE